MLLAELGKSVRLPWGSLMPRVSQSQERPNRRADMRVRRKRMPRCNGGDRVWNIIPTRKRADFRMVIRCETCYRTCRMGKGQKMSRQMDGASKEVKCASSAEPKAWTREELDQAKRWVGKLQRRIAKAQREPFIGFSADTTPYMYRLESVRR